MRRSALATVRAPAANMRRPFCVPHRNPRRVNLSPAWFDKSTERGAQETGIETGLAGDHHRDVTDTANQAPSAPPTEPAARSPSVSAWVRCRLPTPARMIRFATLLADPSLWAAPSSALEDRVVAAITSEAAPAGSTTSEYVVYGRRGRWRWLTAGVAAGAAVAAAVAAIIVVSTRDTQQQPDFAAPLAGTELAAGLRGTADATITRTGVYIAVKVPGLPRRDGGEFYEMWLKSCDGELLIPAGTFHDLADAVGWAGVDPNDFPIVTVTRETAAGPQAIEQGSSGEVVVKGQLAECPAG